MPRSARHIGRDARGRIGKWRTQTEAEGLSTGFATLDDGGIRLFDNELIILAARPQMGKTSVAMQFAANVAQHLKDTGDPGCVLVYSCEMTAEQLLLRMASSRAGVNLQAARMNKVEPEDYDKLDHALSAIGALPIAINDATSPDTTKMDAEIEVFKGRGKPVRLVVADYLELLGDSTATGREPDHLRIARIVTRSKAIAKKHHIPFLMLSQVTRETEAQGGTMMPTMKDMRGSAAIEQTADQMWALMRPQYYLAQGIPCACELASDSKDTIYFSAIKNRNGAGGLTWRFLWSGWRTSMMDLHSSARRQVRVMAVRQPSEFAKPEAV
jgi:replicative DNA helicase